MESVPPAPESFWMEVLGKQLAQGDLLLRCPVPVFPDNYGESEGNNSVGIRDVDVIVVTQSCDLENNKVKSVALCRIMPLTLFVKENPTLAKPDVWEQIRRGRYEALHMLASPTDPQDTTDVRIVDFREIFSLPVGYLGRHAERQGQRWRLRSPYLEHFSQGFARFFMRVGLPSAIPPFKK